MPQGKINKKSCADQQNAPYIWHLTTVILAVISGRDHWISSINRLCRNDTASHAVLQPLEQ